MPYRDKEKDREYRRRVYAKNREALRAKAREKARTPEAQARHNACRRARQLADPEAYREQMRAKRKLERDPEGERARRREISKRWRLDHPERSAAIQAAYDIKRAAKKQARTPDFYKLVNSAVPKGYPQDVRDDIVSSVMLAALEGRVKPKNIKQEVKHYITAHYRMFDQHKTISINAPIPGTEKLSMIDTIADGQGMWQQ